MELFNTAEFSSKNQIGGSKDSAWDDGSAFPEVSSKKIWQVGDRTLNGALIQEIRDDAFLAQWENGRSSWYAIADLEKGFAQIAVNIAVKNAVTDRWNPDHFGEVARLEDGDQMSIFFDDSHEPPDPDDFKNLVEYEAAWKKWECNNSTCAVALEPAIVTQELNSASISSELQKLTNTATAFLAVDTQTLEITATCEASTAQKELTCLRHQHHAHHSLRKDSAKEQTTSETVSPQCLELSENCSPDLLQSKMSQACSTALTDPEAISFISHTFSESFTNAGMMRNGSLSAAPTLTAPSLGRDCCWLPSPGALSWSGKGRPPGQTKQESGLKKLKAIAPGQVVNPEFLESAYNLALGWTDPQENKSASVLIAAMESHAHAEPRLVTCVIPKLGKSHLEECSTSTQSLPVKFLEETFNQVASDKSQVASINTASSLPTSDFRPPTSRSKGCLYKYIENKKLKNGAIASYPRVIGHRDTENPMHWRWGFNWEEKIGGEWKGRSIGSVPLGAMASTPAEGIALIQAMQRDGVFLEEIISFIRRAKLKP